MPQTFGPEENPVTVFSRAMQGGFDASKLKGLRESRLREMEHNLDLEGDSRQGTADRQRERALQSPSERRRDEMRGWGAAPTFSSGATPSDVRNLQTDLNEDPDTGVLAQQRTGRINRTLEDAATTQRQEVSDAVDLGTRRNAFGKYLETLGAKRGQYAADVSPEGSQALDEVSRRKQAELNVAATGKRLAHGGIPIAELKPGQDPLDGLSETEKANIKSLLEYRLAVPSGAALRTPEWMDRLGRAALIDPTFDQSQYKARQDMRTDKKFQENVQSLDTLRKHADELHETGEKLGNYGGVLTPLNSVRNFFKGLTGDPTLAGYGLKQTTVADEYARALKGGVPTQGESEHARSTMGPNLSQPGQDEIHQAINSLAADRLGSAKDRYESVMGKPGSFAAYLDRTRNQASAEAGGTSSAAPQAPAGWRYVAKPGGGWTAVEDR